MDKKSNVGGLEVVNSGRYHVEREKEKQEQGYICIKLVGEKEKSRED